MSVPCGEATAPHSPQKVCTTRSVPRTTLRRLIRDYQVQRAQLEARQTDHNSTHLFRQTLQLQARILTMVIDDLEALGAGAAGRLDHG